MERKIVRGAGGLVNCPPASRVFYVPFSTVGDDEFAPWLLSWMGAQEGLAETRRSEERDAGHSAGQGVAQRREGALVLGQRDVVERIGGVGKRAGSGGTTRHSLTL